jgi:hypothetical protein
MNIDIGGTQIHVDTGDPEFSRMLQLRYGNFAAAKSENPIEIAVDLIPEAECDADLSVTFADSLWTIARGDFRATYDPALRRGLVRQTANPWSIDALIRIVHSLELAAGGGFLIHAASAIRDGRAFVFSGESGAGKTTISRLAPAAAVLLTDEISYIRADPEGFRAWGTPFAGELGTPGPNVSAPVTALYFIEHGPENRMTRMSPAAALRALMKNILFFADDAGLIDRIFATACRFVEATAIFRLAFMPDERVWSLIG